MKRITGILCLLCGLSATLQAQEVGVGINTENPKGILHIDGASTPATTNPASGNISATQASDDMLVDADGRLGLGVAAPAVRVDIKASGAGKALRIEDGTPDKQGKLLVSDAEGTGRWKSVSGGIWWYASLDTSIIPAATADTIIRPYTGYKNALVSTAGAGSVDRTAGTITVPSTGRYRITLCIHFMSNRQGGTPYWSVAALLVNGSGAGNIRWSPSSWGALNGAGMLPTFTTILNLNANDVLLLAMDQREGGETNQAKWRKANYATSPVQLFMVELIQ